MIGTVFMFLMSEVPSKHRGRRQPSPRTKHQELLQPCNHINPFSSHLIIFKQMVKLLTSVAAIAAISHLVTATDATNDNDASVERHRQRRHATERPTNDNNNIFNDEHKNVFAVDVNSTKPSLTNMEYDGSSVGDKYDSRPSVTPYIVGGQAVNPPRKYGVS